jgi:glutamate/tyrosine decarboxylase-like PLP-dependent enzyme
MADVGAIKRAIGRESCMIVASAPGSVFGVMDNVEEIAQVFSSYGLHNYICIIDM